MATVVVAMYNLAKRREKNRAVRPNLEERLLAEGKVNAIRKFQQMFRSRFVSVDRKLLLSRLEMEDQFCYEGCRLIAWVTLFVLFLLSNMVTSDREAQLGVHNFLWQHLALNELSDVVTSAQMWDLVSKVSDQSKLILQSSDTFLKTQDHVRCDSGLGSSLRICFFLVVSIFLCDACHNRHLDQGCALCPAYRTGVGAHGGTKMLVCRQWGSHFGSLFEIHFSREENFFGFGWLGGRFDLGGWVRQISPPAHPPVVKHIPDLDDNLEQPACQFWTPTPSATEHS